MKKILLSWMVVMCVSQSICQESDTKFKEFTSSVKGKCLEGVSNAKLFALTAMYRCQDTLHAFREPNGVKIEKSLDAVHVMKRACKVVQIGVDTEVELLQNIHALGFDKTNATQALHLFNNAHTTMQELMVRYQGFAPWNWTQKMERAAHDVSHWITHSQMYYLYFKGHENCLKNWELLEKYSSIDSENNTNNILKHHNNQKRYGLIMYVKQLISDIQIMKDFIRDDEYKKIYTKLYYELEQVVPILQQLVIDIKKSVEYKKQLEDQLQDRYKQKKSK